MRRVRRQQRKSLAEPRKSPPWNHTPSLRRGTNRIQRKEFMASCPGIDGIPHHKHGGRSPTKLDLGTLL